MRTLFAIFCLQQTFMCVIFRYGNLSCNELPSFMIYHLLSYFVLIHVYKVCLYFYAKSCKGLNDCCQIPCFCCHVNSRKNEYHDIILIRSILSILPFLSILINKKYYYTRKITCGSKSIFYLIITFYKLYIERLVFERMKYNE